MWLQLNATGKKLLVIVDEEFLTLLTLTDKIKTPLRTGYRLTTGANACSEDTRPEQAYCIIRSSQTQAEQLFSVGCYFLYLKFRKDGTI